jgi:hypothetical protein
MASETSKETKIGQAMFDLLYGTIVYQPKSISQKDKIIPEHFLIYNSSGSRPIQLYRREILELIRQLPKAYQALETRDASFSTEIATNKTQRIILEVSLYNDKGYLFLKKMFKPVDKANDPDQEWTYTKSNVSFNPEKDDAEEMLRFVLKCLNV